MPRYNPRELKEYCLQFYRELNNPYSFSRKSPINVSDLETSVDILDSILDLESKEKSFRGLKDQFYSAFTSYLSLPRNQIGSLCVNIDKLSALIDPFLKKVALYFLPDCKITIKNGNRIPLWKTPKYIDILETLKVIKTSEIQKTSSSYWQGKPPDLAILRDGFTARQKGVHESRIHNLEGLEKIVYSIIGTYIIVCLKILKDPVIYGKFAQIIEKSRAAYLFEERVRSFPITGTFFSKKEHLLIYKHRSGIVPDIDGKKFLFLNYLAGRGPCFYWLKEEDQQIIISWAEQFLKEYTDEMIKKNALRFLIENSTPSIKLQTFLESFSDYEDKEELAEYITRFGKPSDRNIVVKLCNDKREEVALASEYLTAKIFSKIDDALKRIAISKSITKRKLTRSIIRNLAKKDDLNQYRNFPDIRDKAQQIIFIYCLGEVGSEEDFELLTNWLRIKRRNETLRIACWYSISRIANRLRNSKVILSLVNNRDSTVKIASLEAMTRDGIGKNFKSLVFKSLMNGLEISDIILEISAPGDNKIIRSYLAKAELNYGVRDLVLALCKVGDFNDFTFLFNLFSEYKDKIMFQNHVRVAEGMAQLCSRKLSLALKKYINSKEFWSYIFSEKPRPKRRLPVKNIENQAFMRRIIAACFIKNADRPDINILRKLIHHDYKWIAYKAVTRFSHIAKRKELDNLTQDLWNLDEGDLNRFAPALVALCLLDKKIYKTKY